MIGAPQTEGCPPKNGNGKKKILGRIVVVELNRKKYVDGWNIRFSSEVLWTCKLQFAEKKLPQ